LAKSVTKYKNSKREDWREGKWTFKVDERDDIVCLKKFEKMLDEKLFTVKE
jgi:hypothetical protein